MSTAMEQIVNAYVRMRNRRALDELRMHRHRLAIDLKLRTKSNYDHSLAVRKMAEDIATIEEGLKQLDPVAELLPSTGELTGSRHEEFSDRLGPVAISAAQLPIPSVLARR
jgi:hypothetical protein